MQRRGKNGAYGLLGLAEKDAFKDQAYFLSQVESKAVKKTLFPLSSLSKAEVKQMASETGIYDLIDNKESTGICFIGKRDFKSFMRRYLSPKERCSLKSSGYVLDADTGQIITTTDDEALAYLYTIGENFRIGGQKNRLFVVDKSIPDNSLTVTSEKQSPLLWDSLFYIALPRWIPPAQHVSSLFTTPHSGHISIKDCFVQIRHQGKRIPCTVEFPSGLSADEISRGGGCLSAHEEPLESRFVCEDDVHIGREHLVSVSVEFPFRAVAPGQVAALYTSDGVCLGGGEIVAVHKPKDMLRAVRQLHRNAQKGSRP